jgi:hypothetical protein
VYSRSVTSSWALRSLCAYSSVTASTPAMAAKLTVVVLVIVAIDCEDPDSSEGIEEYD